MSFMSQNQHKPTHTPTSYNPSKSLLLCKKAHKIGFYLSSGLEYLGFDSIPYLKYFISPSLSSTLLIPCGCVFSDLAEQRLFQGHVAGGSEPAQTGGSVCWSDHTGQRTPAVAPTGRYRRVCVCVFKYQRVPAVSQSAVCQSPVCCLFMHVSLGVTAPSPVPLCCLPVSRCAKAPVRVHRGCRVHGHLPCRLV